MAYALTSWAYREVISSTKLQQMSDNDTYLKAAVDAIGVPLSAQDTTSQSGAVGADFVYATCQITLTPGTWQVQGGASLTSNVNDNSAVNLYNQTAGSDIVNSKGSAGLASTGGLAAPVMTRPVVIVVVAPTVIRVKCCRNAAGATITASGAFVAGAPAAWLNAVRLA